MRWLCRTRASGSRGRGGLIAGSRSIAPAAARSISRCDNSGSCSPESRPSTSRDPASGSRRGSSIRRRGRPCRPARTPSRARARRSSRRRSRARPTHEPRSPGSPCAVGRGTVPGRALVALARGDAGMQRDRRDDHAARDKAGDQLGCEGSPRAGHLGATDLSCVDVLVRGEGPPLRHVAVPNRLAVLAEVCLERLGQIEMREPEPRGGIRARIRAFAAAGNARLSPTSTPPNGSSPRRSSTIQ